MLYAGLANQRGSQTLQSEEQFLEIICIFPLELELLDLLLRTVVDIVYFNSMRPSDNIWHPITGSTLAQVMAWCLMAPSHYLDQCGLIICRVLWHSAKGTSALDILMKIITTRHLKIAQLRSKPYLLESNELKGLKITHLKILLNPPRSKSWTSSKESMDQQRILHKHP